MGMENLFYSCANDDAVELGRLLEVACMHGHVDCVDVLLAAGADVNMVNGTNITPIYFAAHEGFADCAQLLIDAGADVNRVTDGNWTPVRAAASRGHAECVQRLVDA